MNKEDLKQLIRHLIKVCRLSFAFNIYRRFTGKKYDHLFIKGRQNRFAKIYENKIWLEGRASGALSGRGSELANTKNIRDHLPAILNRLKVKILLDIGCGDWTWMQQVELPCRYIGIDIVPFVIDQNKKKFIRPNVEFMVLDAVKEPIPSCDAILCREVLFHLSFSDAKKLLNNIAQSGARFLLMTNDSDISVNADIQTGDYRVLNLALRPFNFPQSFISISDNSVSPGRKIEVWHLQELPKYIVK